MYIFLIITHGSFLSKIILINTQLYICIINIQFTLFFVNKLLISCSPFKNKIKKNIFPVQILFALIVCYFDYCKYGDNFKYYIKT